MHNDKFLDLLIANNLKDMIEKPEVDVDVDRAWKNFEKIVKERKKKATRQRIYKTTLAVAIILLVVGTFNFNMVTAFKVEVQKWISTTDTGGTLITQEINANYEPGDYVGVTFEEAQVMTIFHLRYPRYLPEQINNDPEINVTISEVFPMANVLLTFKGDEEVLIFKQKNLGETHGTNTYVPSNFDVESIIVNNVEINIIRGEENFQAIWNDSSVQYTVFSNEISFEEFLMILEQIK